MRCTTWHFWALLVSGLLLGTSLPARPAESAPVVPPAEDIFAGTNVLRIQIEIPPEGMAALEQTGNSAERPVVKATVKEGGHVFTNVAIRLKGSAGSFRPVRDNPALTLNFDKFASGQTFHQLHKLSLNNSVQDPSFLCEKIGRELFDAAGLSAPRAAFTTVELNGRRLGIHVLTEGFNKQFLARHFKNPHGNLYENRGNQDVTDRLAVNSGDDPNDNSGLAALAAAVRQPTPTARWDKLGQSLDLDHFLSFMAMEVILCHWDGYCMNENNFRIFHDLDSNKMVFIGHGMDQLFGFGTMLLGGQKSTPECPVFPRMAGAVAKSVLSNPQGRRLYLARLSELSSNVFQVTAVLRRVDELAGVLRPVMAESDSRAAKNYDRQLVRLKGLISERGVSLQRQLSAATNPPQLGTNREVHFSNWSQRTQTGSPRFSQETDPDGHVLLHLAASGGLTSASGGLTSASWRANAQLEPGSYRFEGRLRIKDVVPPPGKPIGGAGLRISGKPGSDYLSENTGWRDFAYPFEVEEDGGETVLVCELRASQGEVWFDQASLRIVRRP